MNKLSSFIFWAVSYSELADVGHFAHCYVGHWVVCVQGFQLLIMGDFILQYLKCLHQGLPVSAIPQVYTRFGDV